MNLDTAAQRRIEQAFAEAQARTSAPIEGVVAAASGHYETPGLLLALAATLVAPWPLLVFTEWSGTAVFLVQLIVATVLTALCLWRGWNVLLTPARVRRSNVHHAALAQFAARGLDRAPHRNGVLIYASLTERVVRVEADENALAAVPASQWQALVDGMTRELAAQRVEEACRKAAADAADRLAPAFPPDPAAPKRPRRHFHAA